MGGGRGAQRPVLRVNEPNKERCAQHCHLYQLTNCFRFRRKGSYILKIFMEILYYISISVPDCVDMSSC
jgi:hypothetical protein